MTTMTMTTTTATTTATKQSTLGEAGRFFFSKATPRIIIPLLVVAVVARVAVGGFSAGDIVLVVVLLAFEPLTEWLIHVFVLHFKPKTVAGIRLDLHAAKKHRYHHRNPHDPDTSFVPLLDLFVIAPVMVGFFALITWGNTGRLLTAIITAGAMLLTYEWTHFLIHTAYKPKGRYYKYIWRAHRLHHFKNEHYWMGVTIHLADHLLGTFPQKSEVENSPTARTLGVDI